jgi:hypothetical protein
MDGYIRIVQQCRRLWPKNSYERQTIQHLASAQCDSEYVTITLGYVLQPYAIPQNT